LGDTIIHNLGIEDNYKFLGIQQLFGIAETTARKQVEKNALSRIEKVCISPLNVKNKITAINSWAVPVAANTFGVVKWPDTAIQAFGRKIRTTLTKHRLNHPRSSTHRLYLSRHCGGRGLLSVEVMCPQQVRQLTIYFKAQYSVLHKEICAQDRNYTPLQLCNEKYEPRYLTTKERAAQWRAKELHGRFANALNHENTDSLRPTEWIRTAGLFVEREGFIFAIKDQNINTR
jgi:hypothetical protein